MPGIPGTVGARVSHFHRDNLLLSISMVSQSAPALSIHLSFSLISDPLTLVFQGERGAVGSKGERVSVCVCVLHMNVYTCCFLSMCMGVCVSASLVLLM